jgi:hypothetical protein
MTHVSDMAALYILLLEKILNKEPLPTGENGYYFAMAHKASWWDVMQQLADALHKRGLVNEAKVEIWPSDEMAAQGLGWPRHFVRAMGTSRCVNFKRSRTHSPSNLILVETLFP